MTSLHGMKTSTHNCQKEIPRFKEDNNLLLAYNIDTVRCKNIMCYYENIRSDDNKNAECQLQAEMKQEKLFDLRLATV